MLLVVVVYTTRRNDTKKKKKECPLSPAPHTEFMFEVQQGQTEFFTQL